MTESDSELSSAVSNALLALYQRQDVSLVAQPIAGVGENAYGQVLLVSWPTESKAKRVVVKMAPKNEARRQHMHVVDYYAREVFMYQNVFHTYRELADDHSAFTVAPELLASGLQAPDEFLIFEDLSQNGFQTNPRSSMPTYDIVVSTLKAVAELHACSFILQQRNQVKFSELVDHVRQDNLFTANIETVTIEFGKAMLRRTRLMLEQDEARDDDTTPMMEVLERCERNLKALTLYCVDGASQSPHAVICHGDFWNNNILYRHETHSDLAVEAKLIDFQMSRFAPPVLDLVHYLFACTEKQLRDEHLPAFLNIYYDTLSRKLGSCDLNADDIYPRTVFDRQLQLFGVFGLIMAAFSLPFFISNANEVVNIDEVSEAIQDLSASATDAPKCRELVEEFDMLNERTLPIFKRRMTDVVRDLLKYDMTQPLYQFDSTRDDDIC
ncbi:GL25122 [Drosophila persimilis]|uniref:GL25122 n=1 Tax=Drosophila persimilis TaxID=7234 RepID=B4GR02_DROPE|nr:uncharacterized protein LOC6596032 [Drosophila persimilis]EDW40187.1 GL25122 [Drosophila persimilis]